MKKRSSRLIKTYGATRVYSFKLSDDDLAAMRKVEDRTGATVAEQIRRGVALWLKQEAGR